MEKRWEDRVEAVFWCGALVASVPLEGKGSCKVARGRRSRAGLSLTKRRG